VIAISQQSVISQFGRWFAVPARVAGFNSHRQFAAWQFAYALRQELWPLLRRALHAKDFDLYGNLRRAARSATRNIAEGFGRFKHKDFARFVRMAKASEVEILDHLQVAHDAEYINAEEFAALEHAAKKALKAANGLIRYLESTPDPE
jgi:four helix bundle protein